LWLLDSVSYYIYSLLYSLDYKPYTYTGFNIAPLYGPIGISCAKFGYSISHFQKSKVKNTYHIKGYRLPFKLYMNE